MKKYSGVGVLWAGTPGGGLATYVTKLRPVLYLVCKSLEASGPRLLLGHTVLVAPKSVSDSNSISTANNAMLYS